MNLLQDSTLDGNSFSMFLTNGAFFIANDLVQHFISQQSGEPLRFAEQ